MGAGGGSLREVLVGAAYPPGTPRRESFSKGLPQHALRKWASEHTLGVAPKQPLRLSTALGLEKGHLARWLQGTGPGQGVLWPPSASCHPLYLVVLRARDYFALLQYTTVQH